MHLYHFQDLGLVAMQVIQNGQSLVHLHQTSNKGYATAINRTASDGSFALYQNFNTGTNDADKFGYSVAVSADERWMYISAPADNKVYAYNKVNVQDQRLEFTGDGANSNFVIQPTIQVSASVATAQTQIAVTRNNVAQTAGADYTVSISAGSATG